MFQKLFHKRLDFRTGFLSNFINLSFIQVSNVLLQIFLFPVIFRIIGLRYLGYVVVANSFAALLTIFINYGTNQSGIKDITLSRHQPREKSQVFFSIIYARLVLFCLAALVTTVLYYFHINNIIYYVFAGTIVFAEVINPLFFFIGIEKLIFFNIMNVLAKLGAILLIIFFVRKPEDAYLVNLYIGATAIVAYLVLILYAIKRHELVLEFPRIATVSKLLKENFYLVFNSLSVHLQQSFFLFQLSFTASPLILGAYSLCDKVIWASRLLISSFSSAVYPKSTLMYQTSPQSWKLYKRKLNILLAIVFSLGGLFLFLFPGLCIKLITGNRHELYEQYLRIVSFAPLVIALNSLNVIDVLLRNAYIMIFKISLIILFISILLSVWMISFNQPLIFAYYPLIIESCCLVVYLAFIRKKSITVSLAN
jgi:O-antigen/teichoic acid export membrane protein